MRGLAQILEELQQASVTFPVQMLGVFAEFERATIIDRVVAGMERKAARGGWNGGTVPFG